MERRRVLVVAALAMALGGERMREVRLDVGPMPPREQRVASEQASCHRSGWRADSRGIPTRTDGLSPMGKRWCNNLKW